ncbi:hypothetical protein LCGC14_0743310 [marine sediment metagenome]|uniref:Uncharacterized protein n=1 Tax=marine sediment metagenome TaxID=412755 RepID=A0A0F9SR67_9ZZZZ
MNPIYIQLGISVLLELARRRAIADNDDEGKTDPVIVGINGLLNNHEQVIDPITDLKIVAYIADVVGDLLGTSK